MSDSEEPQVSWRRSKASGGGNCLEVAVLGESVAIRNSRNPTHHLLVTPAEWRAFVVGIKAGEFEFGESPD
jgi:Domain of unknown function (DUF397)